jgi:hypothetical protein
MQVKFSPPKDGSPEGLVSEAEVHFDTEGPFKGLKLVGFSIWKKEDGRVYVTFPSRAFGAGKERKYFDFLRSADGYSPKAVLAFKSWLKARWSESLVEKGG